MDMLFWLSFGAMAVLLLARFLVPALAPDTLLARWLVALIKFGEDDPEADRRSR